MKEFALGETQEKVVYSNPSISKVLHNGNLGSNVMTTN